MSCTKMDRPSDIEVLCRLCLVKDQVHIPIFEEQGDIRQIFLKISCCLPVSISREDNLPKKICDNCSKKLDSLYEFWNTSVNAEKTLLSWLGQAGVKYTDNAISAVVQQITKPETEIKIEDETFEDGEVEPIEINDKDDEAEEIDDGEMEDFDDGEVEDIEDDEPPPPKRARRSAALKAQETLANISDDDEDEEFDTAELVTEVKEESDESEGEVKDPSILNAVPGTSANDQPGPSGLGKNGPDAPFIKEVIQINLKQEPLEIKEEIIVTDPIISENPHNPAIIKCTICDETFTRRYSMHRHILVKHTNNVKNVICDYCDKSFNHKDYLRAHIRFVHSKQEVLKCSLCEGAFKNKPTWRRHIKLQHSESNERLKCAVCGIFFKHRFDLIQHVRLVHKHEERFCCDYCGKCFTLKKKLHIHIEMHHNKRLSQNLELKKVTFFDCHLCSRSYKHRQSLNSHIKLHHPDKKDLKLP